MRSDDDTARIVLFKQKPMLRMGIWRRFSMSAKVMRSPAARLPWEICQAPMRIRSHFREERFQMAEGAHNGRIVESGTVIFRRFALLSCLAFSAET